MGDDGAEAERSSSDLLHEDVEERIDRSQAAQQQDLDEQEVEQERARRLDPDNRPENAEVDNTQREFDQTAGRFTDSDLHEDIGEIDPDSGA